MQNKIEDYNFHIKLMHFYLKSTGFWTSSTNRKINPKRVLFYSLLIFASFVGEFLKFSTTLDDLMTSTEALLYASLTGHALYFYLIILTKQPKINKMLFLVETNFNNFDVHLNRKTQFRLKGQKNTAHAIMWGTVNVIICIGSYLYISRFYLFDLDHTEKRLLYPISLPFQLTNSTYYLLIFFQFATFSMQVAIQLTSISMFSLCINMMCAELDILGAAFENMSEIVKIKVKECDTCPTYSIKEHIDYHARDLLRQYSNHYILLIRFCSDVQSVFRWALLELFVNCEIMLCLCSFQVFQMYQYTEFQQSISILFMLLAIFWHIMVYFWFGEQLNVKSIAFHRAVFKCDWYNYSHKFKRMFRIIFERTKQPLLLRAVIIPVTLTTFFKCLQAAVSYFNLLVALSSVPK